MNVQVCVVQPIETAPKDGSEVLLVLPDGGTLVSRWVRGTRSEDGDKLVSGWFSHYGAGYDFNYPSDEDNRLFGDELDVVGWCSLPRFDSAPDAISRVVAERLRQQNVEGFDADRDDRYTARQLAGAAASYAIHAACSAKTRELRQTAGMLWPWSSSSWKPAPGSSPADRIRDLEKAGALILAEIDRLRRLQEKQSG